MKTLLSACKEYLGFSLLCGAISILVIGCAATPKVSKWTSPSNLTYDQVFNAALKAGTDNKFTIASSDRPSGIISLRKQEYGGSERRMSVQLKQQGDKILVSTKVAGSDVGVIEGALGGKLQVEMTHNFYIYLFRELNITDASSRNIDIEDEH